MCCILGREIPDVLPQSSELPSWSPSQWCGKWYEESWLTRQRQVKWKYSKLFIAHFLPKTRLKKKSGSYPNHEKILSWNFTKKKEWTQIVGSPVWNYIWTKVTFTKKNTEYKGYLHFCMTKLSLLLASLDFLVLRDLRAVLCKELED